MDAPQTDPRPALSDLDLIRRAQMEDISAYEQLVRRYHDTIYGLTYGITNSRHDAKKLTQEVFVKAWKALGHFRLRADFPTWLCRIAIRRVARSRKNRLQRRNVRSEEFDPGIKQSESYKAFSSKGGVLRKMSLSEFQKRINEALNALPEKQRADVILHDVQGMGYAGIAKVLNCSEGVARSRLSHARRKLEGKLVDWRTEDAELDLAGLLALKQYERPDQARAEKNMTNTMRAVRTAHKRPSLHHFPDKSTGWMFAQPRYGVAALFIIFLGLHLIDRPLPDAPVGSSTVEEALAGIDPLTGVDTNAVPEVELPGIDPVYPARVQPVPFVEPNP